MQPEAGKAQIAGKVLPCQVRPEIEQARLVEDRLRRPVRRLEEQGDALLLQEAAMEQLQRE